MDVILKVLEGAKSSTKIAVKKDEFLIGRSQKCHLCAGSSSVSRRHCAITRKDATVSIRDLGSRNGTLVNGKKIGQEVVELTSGDEIGIGTLKLLVTITHGITNLKRPRVKTVAEAVNRTVAVGDTSVDEKDITQWLLDVPGPPAPHLPSSSSQNPSLQDSSTQDSSTGAASETQTIRMDDTNAIELKKIAPNRSNSESSGERESVADSGAIPLSESTASEEDAKKKNKKREPGKLPKRPKELGSKDSREAAMEALRNFNRRR